MKSMTRRATLKSMVVCSLLASAAALFGACAPKEVEFASIDVTGAQYARDFALPDHNGRMRQLKDFAGKVVVVFFGYTQCPDVCPTALAELAEVKRLLGKDGNRLQGIFVTVDPARDTPEVLKAYMEAFDPTFVALATTPETLAAIAKDFKVYYKKSEGRTDTSYTMDHSAGSYVYDTKGQLRLFTRYGSGAALLAKDIGVLLQQGS